MRYAPWLIVLFMAPLLVGCSPDPQPLRGLSALRIKVNARPKIGSNMGRVSVYDQSSDSGYGSFERVDYSDLHDIVVWVEPVAPKPMAQTSAPPVAIAFNDSSSTGVTGVACVGQTIIFRNNGSKVINAYCVSDGNQFNLGALSPRQEEKYVVKSAGVIEILSDAAETPVATVYAAPTCPVFLSHSGVTIDVNNLPPGQYLVVSWHPRLPGSVREVELAPDRVAHAAIDIGVNALPQIDRR